MASRDIRSTRERIRELEAVISMIRAVITGCKSVQKAYDAAQEQGGHNINDLHQSAKDSMAELEDMLVRARDTLTDFINNNGMIFQYQWKAGAANVGTIRFGTGGHPTVSVLLPEGSEFNNTWGVTGSQVLTASNVIQVINSANNDGFHVITSMAQTALYSPTINTADPENSLLARVIFAMTEKGETP